MNNKEMAKLSKEIPQGRIVMNLDMNGHSGKRAFELFICDDGFVELYDVANPKDGFFFDELKEFLSFVNSLNEVLETKAETADRV